MVLHRNRTNLSKHVLEKRQGLLVKKEKETKEGVRAAHTSFVVALA